MKASLDGWAESHKMGINGGTDENGKISGAESFVRKIEK